MTKRTIAEKRADFLAFARKRPKKKIVYVTVWPDSCECSNQDRGACSQECVGKRHWIKCPAVNGGRCTCSATGGKTVKAWAGRRTKYPLGKPLVVHMTEARIAANQRAETEKSFAERWHKISGFIYIHPCDFHIGQDVHWHRQGRVLHGTVIKVNDDMLKPAKVRRKGPVRYDYTPSVYDFCDKDGGKPCVCDLPIGQRTECQHKPGCPVPGIHREMKVITPYDVKPTKDQLAEAREWNKWAGARIPNGPAAGSLMHGTCVDANDLDLATALVLRRIREGGTPT